MECLLWAKVVITTILYVNSVLIAVLEKCIIFFTCGSEILRNLLKVIASKQVSKKTGLVCPFD